MSSESGEIVPSDEPGDESESESYSHRLLWMERRLRSGPIPEASELAAYGRVYGPAPKIIVGMAVDEQKHRHSMQRMDREAIRRGQWFGFIVTGALIVAAAGLVYSGKDVQAFVAVAAAIGLQVGALMLGRQAEK